MILDILEREKIEYRLLDITEDYFHVLCSEDKKNLYMKIFSDVGFEEILHPFSPQNGYTFGYKLTPFVMLLDCGVKYDFCFQIPTFSLTRYYIIPLDKIIQERAWDNYQIINGYKCVTNDIEMIYILTRNIYLYKGFRKCDKDWINTHINILDDDEFIHCLRKVFFGYTDRLVFMLKSNRFDMVFLDYLSYTDY